MKPKGGPTQSETASGVTVVVHQGAIGDWVLTFPLWRGVAEPITVVTAASKGRLAARMLPHVEALDIESGGWSRLHGACSPNNLAPVTRQILAAAKRIISFVSRGDDDWARHAASLAPTAQRVYIQLRPHADQHRHVTDTCLQQMAEQGLAWTMRQPTTHRQPNGPVMIHPGSGGRDKCWPLDRFVALAGKLSRRGFRVRFLLGEVERERWSPEAVRRLADAFEVIHGTDVLQLHDLLHGAAGFIGNDAGPTHLAAQMGLSVLALFGPTDPAVWSPRGPGVRVLAPPSPAPMTWLTVEHAWNFTATDFLPLLTNQT
ncbi:MAG: glycosyltransferase family 9 protein [Phycisphaeraceae bacterium]|nr:glycosyltransferase family 9 protein [Phycisphaeraceae bacterium]